MRYRIRALVAALLIDSPVHASAGVRVGTVRSTDAPYYLAVFSDPKTDELLPGLHATSLTLAQLWEFDEGSGLVKARGVERFLTAVSIANSESVVLADIYSGTSAADLAQPSTESAASAVPVIVSPSFGVHGAAASKSSDWVAQTWMITLNGHIVLLRNGKSLSFSSAQEGMRVRLALTSDADMKQGWVFAETPHPTESPTTQPAGHGRVGLARAPGHRGRRLFVALSLVFVCAAVAVASGTRAIASAEAAAPPATVEAAAPPYCALVDTCTIQGVPSQVKF